MNTTAFQIELSAAAWEDLQRLPKADVERILRKLARLESGLVGDLKRLQNSDYGYRLRMGNFRALFDVQKQRIVVRKIGNRRDVYD